MVHRAEDVFELLETVVQRIERLFIQHAPTDTTQRLQAKKDRAGIALVKSFRRIRTTLAFAQDLVQRL